MIRFRLSDRMKDALLATLMPAGMCGAALLMSVYLAHSDPGSAIAPAAVAAALLLAARLMPNRWRWGSLIGFLILAAIDALPGPDLDTRMVITGVPMQYGVVALLVLVLAVHIVVHRLWSFFGTGIGRVLLLASLANLAWWIYTLLRTSAIPGIVLKHSVESADDLIFITILVPMLAASFQDGDTRIAALATAGVLGLIPAGFFCLATFTHSGFNAFIHATNSMTAASSSGAGIRLFVPAHDLFTASFAVSVAAALLMPPGNWRRLAVLVATVNLVAILAGQTRAQYLGTSVGFIVASAFYLWGPGGRLAVRRIVAALAAAGVVVALLLGGFPHSSPAQTVRAFGTRIGSISSSLSSSNAATSTVAVRGGEEELLKQRLGSHWLLGLGFIDPRDAYDANLPFGTVRNADVGISNTVMTMGVIGTVLYYTSILAVMLTLLWQSRRRTGSPRWMRYGSLLGLIGVLLTSITLTTFFSATGVVTVATLIALGAAASIDSTAPQDERLAPQSDVTAALSSTDRTREVVAGT